MSQITPQLDNLQRFIFDNAPVRGEWVHMQESWQEVLKRRDYPPAVQRLLGEMMAAAALLTATVKMTGRLVLQIRAEGPVSLAMVECTSQNTLRALAQWEGHIHDDAKLSEVTGAGTLAITIEVEGAKQPYQGVVSLEGDSIATVLETYFRHSEQLATRIWLAANDRDVAGMLLQQLPDQEDVEQEHWSRISQLADTVTDEEMLGLDALTMLHRLFHEEQVRLLSTTDLSFACTCSRERVADTISLLGQQEAESILDERGEIEVACQFCNEHYIFDKVDVAEIFTNTVSASSDPNTLH